MVSLTNGTRLPAEVIGSDELTDVALDRGSGDRPAPRRRVRRSRQVEVGDWVLAAGNPFGLGGSVTAGKPVRRVDGRDLGAGPFDNFLQLDAPINPGNSGGPIFNMDGQVVGVSTAIVSPSGGSVGIGFATPCELVMPGSSTSCASAATSSAAGSAYLWRTRTTASPSPALSAQALLRVPACVRVT